MKCVIRGKGSFNQIASHLKDFDETSCSRQSVLKRIDGKCVSYLSSVAYALVANHSEAASEVCKKWGVKRILTENSTLQRMHNSNAANFPGHGNKQSVTSGFKADLIYDLLTGKPLSKKLSGGTEQDKTLGKRILEIIRKDDLVLRDMGYFNNIALELGIIERKTISRVAVYKRITNNAPQFLRAVIGELVKQSSSSISTLCSRHEFTRVLIEDSTFQVMGKGNASNFPGHGNGVGRTAGFKLDLAFDLLTGSTLSQTFTHGTHQNKSLGKYLLNQIKPGDLVVRDMGYFVTESFKLIGEMSAFWQL